MDDKFLYRYRRIPPADFEEALYSHLERQKGLRLMWAEIRSSRRKSALSAAIALAAIGLMAACAREVFAPRWVQIGEYEVLERSRRCPDASFPIQQSQPQPEATNPPPDAADLLTLDEIKSRLAYDLKVPTWAPEGFEPHFMYTDVLPMMSISYDWHGVSVVGGISMYSSPVNTEFDSLTTEAHTKTAESVKINGNPGLLIRGGCGFASMPEPDISGFVERVWDDNINRLIWRANGVNYNLYSISPEVSAQDLVRMADSAR